jgi:hypothetical protein
MTTKEYEEMYYKMYYDKEAAKQAIYFKNILFQRERLMNYIETGLANPRFQRDYMYKGNTYCNQFSEWVLRMMGYDTHFMYELWKEKNILIVTYANLIYDKIKVESTYRNEIKKVTKEEARELSWKGIPALLIARSNRKNVHGHLAVTYPTPPAGEALKIGNAGWFNLICTPEDKKSFGGGADYLSPIDYYLLPQVMRE